MAAREAPEVLTVRSASRLPLAGGCGREGRDQTPDATTNQGATATFGSPSFRWMWPRWQPPPGDGLVAIAQQGQATLGWADALLTRRGSDLYVWAAVDAEPERYALDLIDRPGVVAATMAWDHADPRKVNLALEVAAWLASRRATDGTGVLPGSGCLTAWSPPATPPGVLRVPRLVTLVNGSTVTDAVVWELLPAASLHERLGELPDLSFVESNLDVLIDFRAMLRAGRVPATPVTSRVLDLMEGDTYRDLSIELIVAHIDLFWVLVEAMTAGRRARERDNLHALALGGGAGAEATYVGRPT